ncbi:unnamed protein product [Mytilus edulis]|uniref:Uncharacterized protein n=1 Tax=Mytilus edulis TaxID=6550 RepID=A0A8S3VPW3_MYTED|nr:unnamed protein product [Mytilus edulis]
MTISRKLHKPDHPKLNMDNVTVTEVSTHKHLGLHISNDGTWHKHIDVITEKAYKRLNVLRKFKFILDRRTLETIYLTYIRPLLEYADVIWDNTHLLIDKIKQEQTEAATIVTEGPSNDGTPPLQIACYNNRIEVVRVLLQCDDVDIDLCDDDGCSSLYWATDVNKCSNDGTPPLQIACYNNRIEVVRVLLQCDDVDIDLCDDDGCSSLYIATDVNKCRNDGTPPLQIACSNNMIEVVHELLQCDDVRIDLCDDDGCSALYIASQDRHVDVVKGLLQHSSDVKECNDKDQNPLHVAHENVHLAVESLLVRTSANQH